MSRTDSASCRKNCAGCTLPHSVSWIVCCSRPIVASAWSHDRPTRETGLGPHAPQGARSLSELPDERSAPAQALQQWRVPSEMTSPHCLWAAARWSIARRRRPDASTPGSDRLRRVSRSPSTTADTSILHKVPHAPGNLHVETGGGRSPVDNARRATSPTISGSHASAFGGHAVAAVHRWPQDRATGCPWRQCGPQELGLFHVKRAEARARRNLCAYVSRVADGGRHAEHLRCAPYMRECSYIARGPTFVAKRTSGDWALHPRNHAAEQAIDTPLPRLFSIPRICTDCFRSERRVGGADGRQRG